MPRTPLPRTPLRRPLLALAALLTAVALAACGAPPNGGGGGGGETVELPADPEALVAQARQEGAVVIAAGGHTREQVQLLSDTFRERYGIDVQFIRESSGDIAQKLQAQQTSRSLQFDVVSLNDEGTMRTWADTGVLADPALADPARVLGPLRRPDAPYVPFTWAALGYSYNQSRTPAAQAPRTWTDLAGRPGVIAAANPGSSGAALTFVGAMEQIDPAFVPSLGERQTLVPDSALALTQLLATGEADFGVPGVEADIATARRAGEPLAIGYPEGPIGALPSYVAPLSGAPHPAAARLLVQFQLSEEFQALQVRNGSRSTLNGLPAPEGAENIGEDRLRVPDAADLERRKDDLVASFTASTGG